MQTPVNIFKFLKKKGGQKHSNFISTFCLFLYLKLFSAFIQDKCAHGLGREWKKHFISSELFIPLTPRPLHTLFPKWNFYLAQGIIIWLLQLNTLLKSATVSSHSYVQHLRLSICRQITLIFLIITVKSICFCLWNAESQHWSHIRYKQKKVSQSRKLS